MTRETENLEVVRTGVRLFAEGDVDAIGDLYTPDAIVYAPAGWPESEDPAGREAIVRQYRRLREDWTRHEMTVEREFASGDRVVVQQLWQAEGASSGAPMEARVFGAYRVAGGQIREVRFFWSWEEAMEAAGLVEGAKD